MYQIGIILIYEYKGAIILIVNDSYNTAHTANDILFSRTNNTRFKGNKSRYVPKSISYLFIV